LEIAPQPDTRTFRLSGRDNNGTPVLGDIPLPWRQSALP